MPELRFTVSIGWSFGLAALAAATVLGVYFAWRPADTPAEKEHQRRMKVSATGRFADGTAVDFRSVPPGEGEEPQELVFYQYSVGGVDYSAAQDVADLKDRIAGSPRIVGWVNVKYQPRNPSNSIIICEEWSGVRTNGRGAGERNGSAS